MKYLALALVLVPFASWVPLHAEDSSSELSESAKWQQVLLFDWVYPGETAYQDLKSAATATSSDNWLVARMERGDKLPQASARELAFSLSHDARVADDLKQRLIKDFPDEPELLRETGTASAASRIADISNQLDDMSKAMDDISAMFNRNRYGKGGAPDADIGVWSGYVLDAPAGLLQSYDRGYAEGGLDITLRGTLDKVTYAINLGEEYVGIATNGLGVSYDYSSRLAYMGNYAFSFLLPLDSGGLEIHMGEQTPVDFSTLLLSTVDLANANNFFVDITQSYRPATTINAANLAYPEASALRQGILVKRQGATWYWPFTASQFLYSDQDLTYYEGFDAHFRNMALRVDEELGPKGDWIDDSLIYGTYVFTFTDPDDLFAQGYSGTTYPLSDNSYALGTKIEFSSGASLTGEFADSDYKKTYPDYFTDESNDYAWNAILILPVGPLHIAYENDYAGPNFITLERYGNFADISAPLNRLQQGATYDSTMGSLTDDSLNGMKTTTWLTMVKDPSVLSNNTTKNVIKTEWHGSFLSFGIYDGVTSQINPSGPFVQTAPVIEGSSSNGHGWFDVFGQSYDPPWYLNSPTAYLFSPGANPYIDSEDTPGNHYLYQYDEVSAGPAFYKGIAATNGFSAPFQYSQLSQLNYQRTEFTVALTQNGVGDSNLLDDSVKVLNYAGATTILDFKGLLDTQNPLNLIVVAEDRDLVSAASLPTLGANSLFNQQYVCGYFNWGLSPLVTLLATGGYEVWSTEHSYYPINIITSEWGLGADFKMDPYLSQLVFNLRGTLMRSSDTYFESRDFSVENISLGMSLTY